MSGTLGNVEETLREATSVLTDVRTQLAEIAGELELVKRLPEMEAQLCEIHQAVTRDT